MAKGNFIESYTVCQFVKFWKGKLMPSRENCN